MPHRHPHSHDAVPMMVDFSISAPDDDTITVVVAGELDLLTSGEFETVLDAAADRAANVFVDLSAVSFADSTALTVLVKSHVRLTERERRLVIARPSDTVQRVLELSGLVGVLHVDPPPVAAEQETAVPS